jgi:uncharacterized repeat protein (TIGR01451 family)
MRRTTLASIALLAAVSMVVIPGCKSHQHKHTEDKVVVYDAPKADKSMADKPMTDPFAAEKSSAKSAVDGMTRGTLAYPTGDRKTSALLLEKAVPSEIVANKPYTYEIKVTNITANKLEGVEITETLPAGLKLADAVQGATLRVDGANAKIGLGTLNPGESKVVKIGATATQAGAVSGCSAITYNTSLCLGLNVVSPAITANATLPSTDVLVCDNIPLKVTVTNSGTGVARNVKVTDTLPEGLTLADGKKDLALHIGNLAAGESKTVEVMLKASKTGNYSTQFEAVGDDLPTQSIAAAVNVRQPRLVVTKAGPKNIFVGSPFTYELEIENKGDGIAKDSVLTDNLPAGFVVVDASDAASVSGNRVTWNVGDLAPGAKKKVLLTVRGTAVGTARNSVTGQANCADPATVSAETQVSGVPAILLEVVDSPDPVQVGQDTTYTITVTNQGSAPSTNVKVLSMLEDNMEFVSAGGAAAGKLEGKEVRFESIASLAPGAKAVFTVVVKAKGQEDVRFKTVLTADQFKREIEETESTNFYK